MKGHLVMSWKERKRKSVFDRMEEAGWTLLEASRRLGLSYRQTLRSYERYKSEGDAGLVHRSRGRPSNRGKPAGFREQVIERYKERYADIEMGPTLAAEKLAQDGYEVAAETLRRWLLEAGHWNKRRKRRKHRSRRARKCHFGELVQLDGSHHRWFGPDAPPCCLMNLIDDATGKRMSLMAEEETTEAAMALVERWVACHGAPQAIYVDRKSVYVTDREPTLEEQLAGEEPKTALGKSLAKLDIDIIEARSPQAKGRVERCHGVYQDRFVKELALRSITTIAGANKLLNNGFVDELNEKFAREPLEPNDFHRPVPKGLELADVFCFEDVRVVQNDWTVRHQNTYYQILKDNAPLPKPKDKIVVRTRRDTSVYLLYKNKRLDYRVIPKAELRKRIERKKRQAQDAAIQKAPSTPRTHKPAADHPWRKAARAKNKDQYRL